MRLHKVYDDEIGDLCDTINHMSEEIGKAERMKNDFISSVSHELRTPLTAIGGWSDTLIAGGATDPEEVIMGLGIIQKESRRLTQMVEELLDFTRLESGRMKLNVELFDVGAELYEAVYMYENMLEKENIQLEYDIPDQMCPVNGDRHRMKQVFLNIIDNAAKYGKSGGRIRITLSRDSYTVMIEVRDWGVGIKEDELPFVKEKFYKGSSKQRGSGIGLAVTDEIVRMHGGTLNVASIYGEGHDGDDYAAARQHRNAPCAAGTRGAGAGGEGVLVEQSITTGCAQNNHRRPVDFRGHHDEGTAQDVHGRAQAGRRTCHRGKALYAAQGNA